MAVSTEKTVRDVIVGAIRGVASALGFEEPDGNVQDYLLEWEEKSLTGPYLMTWVNGARKVRVWGVDVVASDPWFASGNIVKRDYTITIQGFEEVGVRGAGVNQMVDSARIIRGGILALGSRLSNTVDLVKSVGDLRRNRVSGFDEAMGDLIKGTMIYVAEKANPDF